MVMFNRDQDLLKSKLKDQAKNQNIIALMSDEYWYLAIYNREDESTFLKAKSQKEVEILQKDLISKATEALKAYENKRIGLVVKNGDFTPGLIIVISVCRTLNIELSVLCYGDHHQYNEDGEYYYLPKILQSM